MPHGLTENQRKVLDLLQGDLPDGLRPFDALAERAGIPPDRFLEIARELIEAGYMRKVSGLVNHYEAGFRANAMCVWRLPPERVDEAGEIMAGFDEVTHCYRRPVSDEWTYPIFCMVHGRTREACEKVAAKIAKAVNPTDYTIIYSTRELKKRSIRLPL